MNGLGKKVWLIPDCFIPSKSTSQLSHDAICVLNTGKIDAVIKLTLYFEDKAPIRDYEAFCKADRTHHIRMDKILSKSGEPVPRDVPYAALVESNTEIVVQYSRLDTSSSMALMTTIAYPVE
ncbi:MAG: hypothetical protein E7480_04230 [Ruminococcaceae bacterium]|nr:hypothetical protein [Oscillospiraceae bacterium]